LGLYFTDDPAIWSV